MTLAERWALKLCSMLAERHPEIYRSRSDTAVLDVQKITAWAMEEYAKECEASTTELTPEDSGMCCMKNHATAIPPWTCGCACHNEKETNGTNR